VWEASDEAVLAGLATGDRDAAAVFVRRFQRRVLGVALAVTGDLGRAEDVAQEAFVRAWRHAGAFDPRRGSVLTWLLAITRNLAIDARRVEAVRPAVPAPMVGLDLTDRPPVGGGTRSAGTDPADVAARNDEAARVAVAMQQLPTEQRRALVLATIHGLTAREVGLQEQVPLGTAKTRIRTALLRLRDSLLETPDSQPDEPGGHES
jgi:RNA polymerase sigma-70 factor (ECF subfamily)